MNESFRPNDNTDFATCTYDSCREPNKGKKTWNVSLGDLEYNV